jgi:hypothetical protein
VLLGGPSNFGVNAAATKVIDMGDSYTGVIVSFTFFKIDSWDSETAQLYVTADRRLSSFDRVLHPPPVLSGLLRV